jgi:tyrosyl-DNA phosphodiesterase-1
MKLRRCLNAEPGGFPARFAAAPVVAQYSSVGSLSAGWLADQFLASASAGHAGGRALGPPPLPAGLHLVWPTVEEVQNSVEGWFAGRSIPGRADKVRRDFLQQHYRRWGGASAGRQRAMPHIKTYARFDPGSRELAWFCVTSHNLSKVRGRAGQGRAAAPPATRRRAPARGRQGVGAGRTGRGRGAGAATRAASSATCRLPQRDVPPPPPLTRPDLTRPGPQAAWGEVQNSKANKRTQLKILSFELGVLLVPSLERAYRASRWRGFSATRAGPAAPGAAGPLPGAAQARVRFVAWRRGEAQGATLEGGVLTVPLPLPYALPPEPYAAGDVPWDVRGEGLPPWSGRDALGFEFPGVGRHYGVLEAHEWADVVGQ